MKLSEEAKKWLTPYQIMYWTNPEKMRAEQRAKYARYPEKIKSINKAWQEKNKDHWRKLVNFGCQIFQAKKAGDMEKVQVLKKAREEYKKAWRASRAKD